jgi:hypothetical protein
LAKIELPRLHGSYDEIAHSSGKLPSGVLPKGVCGSIGQRSLSKTHKEAARSDKFGYAIRELKNFRL